jgi:acetyltransferase
VLSDDWQGRGLGTRLLAALLVAAKRQGIQRLYGTALTSNRGMLTLAKYSGFTLTLDPLSATVTSLSLNLA